MPTHFTRGDGTPEREPDPWRKGIKCGARTRTKNEDGTDKYCKNTAGLGTDHLGYGRCKYHGGCAPGPMIAAAKEEAVEEVKRLMGPALEVDPMDALLWCVRIAAGEVAYATAKISELEEQDLIGRPETETTREGYFDGEQQSSVELKKAPHDLNVWVKVRHASMDRLARYSKSALDAGIAEREIALAEAVGDQLADAIRNILDGLGLNMEQEKRAPVLVRNALIELEKVNATQAPVTLAS